MGQERRVQSSSALDGTYAGAAVASASDPAWLTVSQLCRRWQLDRKTVYKFIDANVLPAWKVGSHLYRVAVDDVLRFEAQNRLLR
jgi:excisionase family DNA binding protein